MQKRSSSSSDDSDAGGHEYRRSAITGKIIKLKVNGGRGKMLYIMALFINTIILNYSFTIHFFIFMLLQVKKSADDKIRDKNRGDLLKFLNQSYD